VRALARCSSTWAAQLRNDSIEAAKLRGPPVSCSMRGPKKLCSLSAISTLQNGVARPGNQPACSLLRRASSASKCCSKNCQAATRVALVAELIAERHPDLVDAQRRIETERERLRAARVGHGEIAASKRSRSAGS